MTAVSIASKQTTFIAIYEITVVLNNEVNEAVML
jgi:hypothetical protein